MSDEKCKWCGKRKDVYHLPHRAECLQNLLTAANTENETLRERVTELGRVLKKHLPQIADLHKAHIDITGGVESSEYVRRLRDKALLPAPAKDDGAGVVFDTEEGDR